MDHKVKTMLQTGLLCPADVHLWPMRAQDIEYFPLPASPAYAAQIRLYGDLIRHNSGSDNTVFVYRAAWRRLDLAHRRADSGLHQGETIEKSWYVPARQRKGAAPHP